MGGGGGDAEPPPEPDPAPTPEPKATSKKAQKADRRRRITAQKKSGSLSTLLGGDMEEEERETLLGE